jgi:MtaA/CmuA family methyltransferase
MNSLERVKNRLQGAPVDRAPNFDIIMGYGAHQVGETLAHYLLDYRVLCRMNMSMLERFNLDLVQVISDPFREAADFGMAVEFPEDGLPVGLRPLLVGGDDLERLKPPDPVAGRRMSDRLEAVGWLHQQVGGETPVMGWVEGALAEACDLCRVAPFLTELYDRPPWARQLLDICCAVEIAFARAQVAAGADIIGLGDAIASQVSPAMYRKYALPYEQRIFAEVHRLGALARLHICGDTTRILADMATCGADIIDVDWMVDFGAARAAFEQSPTRPAVCGNADPVSVFYQGSTQEVYQATTGCLAAGGARCFIAAGCEIPDKTPAENLDAQQRALADFTG